MEWFCCAPAVAVQARERLAYPLLARVFRQWHPHKRGLPPLPEALESGQIRRVLCIRLGHIGDLVLSLPAMQAIKQRYPFLTMDALVDPTSAQVLAGQAALCEILTYDAPHFSRQERKTGFREFWATVRALRGRRYDLAVTLHGDDTARLMAFFSGARYRLGPEPSDGVPVGKPNLSILLTHMSREFLEPCAQEPHAIEYAIKVLEPLGVEQGRPLPQAYLTVSQETRAEVTSWLKKLGIPCRFAALHARSSAAIKDWRPERFAAVADILVEEYGFSIVLTGAPQDHECNQQIISRMQKKEYAYDASLHISLQNLPALMERAEILVSVDTGAMHIAAAVGTPLVALFLPYFAGRFRPSNARHEVLTPMGEFPIGKVIVLSGDGPPLDGISVDQVMAAVARLLGQPCAQGPDDA